MNLDRWRTGGTVEEVIDEAGLSPDKMIEGIERFVRDRERRLSRQEHSLAAARGVKIADALQPEPSGG